MSKVPMMPLWVGDFIADTLELDAQELGAYTLILVTMWKHGGSLPSDSKKLQRVARIGRNWPKVWASIEQHFDEVDGRITNAKLTEEYTKVRTKLEVNAHNGARGGKAKALKTKERALANATVSLYQSEPELELREKEEPKGSSKKKGKRLSQDWVLPKPWGDWAVGQGMDELAVRRESDKFRDYWVSQAGQRGVKLDWQATWRNWVRKYVEDHPAKRKSEPRYGDRRVTTSGKVLEFEGGAAGWVEVHE